MLVTWCSTVRGLRKRRTAIWSLERPRPTRRATSSSRRLRPALAGGPPAVRTPSRRIGGGDLRFNQAQQDRRRLQVGRAQLMEPALQERGGHLGPAARQLQLRQRLLGVGMGLVAFQEAGSFIQAALPKAEVGKAQG